MSDESNIPGPECCSNGNVLFCNNDGVWEEDRCNQVGDMCSELQCCKTQPVKLTEMRSTRTLKYELRQVSRRWM